MCCFSLSVQRVANTRIFSRRLDETRQGIAYQMEFAADSDLAMILPLPVVPRSGEEAVKFKLFFPTVHIHDGEVHAKEHFDHELYCQVSRPGLFEMMKWEESPGLAKGTSKVEKSEGLLFGDSHIYRRRMIGDFANKDVILGAA